MFLVVNTHERCVQIYIARLSLVFSKALFNELEAECLPLTADCEWLINQTALLSSIPLNPHQMHTCLFFSVPQPEPTVNILYQKWARSMKLSPLMSTNSPRFGIPCLITILEGH